MPKYVSLYGSPGWTHLYPAISVDADREGRPMSTGPAYCGENDREVVFAPGRPGETLDKFAQREWARTCDRCSYIVRRGLITDPEFIGKFREEVLGDA